MNELDTLKANAEEAYRRWRAFDALRPFDQANDARGRELLVELALAEDRRRRAQLRAYAAT
jgi:hypothetical protein